MSDKRKSLNGPESGEKKVGRRGFLKVALGAAAAIIAAAAGLILIRKPQKQETVAPPSVTSALVTPATTTSTPVTPATQPPQTADLVLMNGKIITVDPNDSIAEAVAVSGGKITKVGTTEEIGSLIGDYTQVIDLKGRTVTPGLTDAHCHTGGGWAEIYQLDVRPNTVGSIADIVKLIDEKVKETPNGEWILGFGWRPDGWPERRRPNRSDLDPVSPNHPVFLTDSSGWYGWANSYALRLAGIDENTPNPVGGVIDRDSATNLPTGLLVNHAAMWLVKKPTPTKEQCEEGIRYASNLFVAEGVTTIHDNWVKGIDLMQAYQSLDDLGEPPARTDVYYHINSEEEAEAALTALKTLKPFKHAVTFKGWKLQVDGGAATAFTYESHNGYAYTIPSLPPDVLKRIVSVLHKSGYQISIHVGGDRAIDVTLDAIEAALKENPRPNHRHRLEHVIVSPKEGTLERIKELGVVISVQPSFVYHSGDIWLNLFGQERVKMAAPVKTAIDMGIPVAFGSDYPCTVDTSPQLTLWSAITRQTSTGVIIGGQESVDVRQALRIHTMGSAYAANEENVKGSIEAGKQADLVVWSDDIYSIPTDKIRDLKAELVIIEGQILLK